MLIENYVDEINKTSEEGGVIPSITSAWDSVVQKQIEMCYLKCNAYIKNQSETIVLPQDPVLLYLQFDQIRTKINKMIDRVRNLLDRNNQMELEQI